MVVLLVVLRSYGSVLIPSKKLLRNCMGKMARILPRRPNLAQDLAQDPGQEFGRHNLGTLDKVLGKRWQVLGKCWASSSLAQELFANVIFRTGLILN